MLQGTDISKQEIATFLDANNGKIEDALDALLKLKEDESKKQPAKKPPQPQPQPQPQKQPQKPPQPQPQPQPQPKLGVENGQRKHNVAEIKNIFGDLTVSVISTIYDQNEGNVQSTIDTLLNIHQDPEALEQIRNLNIEQKKKLEAEMQKEEEKRIRERQKKS